jgi:tetratricopeptide (TPR) repeat protein
VEEVCGTTVEELAGLVRHSLLRRDDDDEGPARFRMLETIREYAGERLRARGDADAVARRHAEHFLRLAERAEPELRGGQAREWLSRLDEEQDNLRAALRFATRADPELALRLAAALQYFWRVRGLVAEGRRQLEDALTAGSAASAPVRAKAIGAAAVLVDRQGDHDIARGLYEDALTLYRAIGDHRGTARMLSELAGLAIEEGDLDLATALFEESIPLHRRSGDQRALMVSTANLASVATLRGDLEQGRVLGEEALALARADDDADQVTISLYNLGRIALGERRFADASALFAESLHVARDLGYRELVAYGILGFGELATAVGDVERGARLVGAGLAFFESHGIELGPDERSGVGATHEALGAALGDARRGALVAEGRALSLDAAADDAATVGTAVSRVNPPRTS